MKSVQLNSWAKMKRFHSCLNRGQTIVVTVGFAHLKEFGVVGEFLR
jgi:hypothetical protein